MKKYFLKGTGEEVKIGGIVALDLEGKGKRGDKVREHLEVRVNPMMLALLIEEGVIEERNLEDKMKEIKFNIEELKKHTVKGKIDAKLDELDKRLTEVEGIIAEWDNE